MFINLILNNYSSDSFSHSDDAFTTLKQILNKVNDPEKIITELLKGHKSMDYLNNNLNIIFFKML
mgnify:CR=1 FL=1